MHCEDAVVRLYLSSYQFGAHPERLVRLVRGNRRGWVIANALDGLDEDRRKTDIKLQVEALAALGLEAADLDLRELNPPPVSLRSSRLRLGA